MLLKELEKKNTSIELLASSGIFGDIILVHFLLEFRGLYDCFIGLTVIRNWT